MNNPADPKTPDEIRVWRTQELCRALLGSFLQPSDCHDEEEGREHQPLMTADGAWYFVPHYDDPVPLPHRALTGGVNGPTHDYSRPRWGLEALKVEPATRDEPESYDLVEVTRRDSLEDAMRQIGHILLEQEHQNISLFVHEQYEAKMRPHIEDYMTSTE